jgi:hypothetical protein
MSSHSMSKNGNTDARTAMLQEKADDVQRVLDEPIVDLWLLRELALTEGGLVNGQYSGIPKKATPISND